ncbi:MAG: hypothetical protein KDB00_09725 [Planctomycetales bacterium]|nr:hypothetical protein [Planctomycetales bacterium]
MPPTIQLTRAGHSVFAVDVLSCAVMSNHLHQILRIRTDVVAKWSDEEVPIHGGGLK